MGLPDNIKLRMYIILAAVFALPVFVAMQLLGIYVSGSEKLVKTGEKQARSVAQIPAMRGSIYDREGRELVVNTASYNLALDPMVDGFSSAIEQSFFEKLSLLTGASATFFEKKVEERVSPRYVVLWENLDESQKQVVQKWKVPGVLIVRALTRRYNYGKTASHVIGHVSKDGKGIDGLELYYQEYLHGEPGHRAVQRDRNGDIKAYAAGETLEPVDGQNLYLTIDLELQAILEDELAAGVEATKSEWGVAMAMEPSTGAILGMANVPFYDPNDFSSFGTAARRNRAIADRLEPGSTFKLITAAAAVETGTFALEDSIDTGNGYAVVGGRGMHDLHGYGRISFADAIVKSSNIGIAQTAVKLEPGIFYQYARNLGFGQKTWIDLPGEVDGTLKKTRDWTGASQASMSIGYEIDATPLQILTAYGALANGGVLMKPHVLARRTDLKGNVLWEAPRDSIRRALKKETVKALLPAFVDVVEKGTAKLAKVEGLPIAGKTGTARIIIDGAYNSDKHRASFVGFFPADDPQVVVLIMLAKPGVPGNSGAITTPIFQRVARRWASAMPDLHRPKLLAASEPAENKTRALPQVQGLPATVAVDRLLAAGFKAKAPKPMVAFHSVVQQPSNEKGLVDLEVKATEKDTALTLMPDLSGLSLRQAVHWSHVAGIDVKIEGQGMVVSHSPKAGEPLLATAVLRCR